MMTIFWIIYFFVAGAISTEIAYGMAEHSEHDESKLTRFIISTLVSLAWPLFFAYVLLFGPIELSYMDNDSAANKEKDEDNS